MCVSRITVDLELCGENRGKFQRKTSVLPEPQATHSLQLPPSSALLEGVGTACLAFSLGLAVVVLLSFQKVSSNRAHVAAHFQCAHWDSKWRYC